MGVTALWPPCSISFFPSVAAADIGWEVSAFQFEMGMGDLAFGATAFTSFWCSRPFKAAAVGASSILLLDDAVGHVHLHMLAEKFRARQRWRRVTAVAGLA